MIFKLIIIIAVKQSERKLKNILQVVKLNEPPAKKTTERYHLTKKNSLANQLEVIVFKRQEVVPFAISANFGCNLSANVYASSLTQVKSHAKMAIF